MDKGTSLLSGIARTIITKPSEQWLVITHRPGNKVGDIEAGVRKLIAVDPDNPYPDVGVSFLTWGQHMATNDYVDHSNVILAGTLFYRPSFYEALKRLAADRPATSPIPVTKEELDRTIAGEHAHLILKALCRGSVERELSVTATECSP